MNKIILNSEQKEGVEELFDCLKKDGLVEEIAEGKFQFTDQISSYHI